MFVALEIAGQKNSGIFGSVLNILTKQKARIEAHQIFGASYGVISTPPLSRPSDWNKIASLSDRYGDRLLLPAGLIPPPPLKAAVFPRYERLVLLKTACEIIKRTRMPMYRRIAGLADEHGEYADFLYPLLQHFTAVKVLSKNTLLYAAQAEKMMEELGAPVLLREDISAFSDCVLMIAPEGVSLTQRLRCPVLSKSPPKREQPGDFISDLRAIPSAQLAAACPAGIDPHDFSAALYEYCGVDSINFLAGQLQINCRQADLVQAVKTVMFASGTLSVF